ncbi:MAG: amidase [Eubacteriales bacterium]
MGSFSEFEQYDGLGLAQLVKTKQIRPDELVEETISRIEDKNPKINAVIHKMYDYAHKTACEDLPDGPFQGVPFLLKDIGNPFAGEPFCSGSKFLKDNIPDHDSELVKRYKAAGLIVVGKTNTPEFGLRPVTEPELFGSTNNPWDLSRTSGGSSGGSAASVAARIVPMADGSDGGGSLRHPASCCGIFTMKPTRGRTPTGPDHAELWQGMACCHALTRSVRDNAALLDAVSGPDPGAPYYTAPPSRPFLSEVSTAPGKLHIAYSAQPFYPSNVHPDCAKGLEETARLCQSLGHDVEETSFTIDGEAFARAFFVMTCSETMATIKSLGVKMNRRPSHEYFETTTWVMALLAKQFTADEFSKAIDILKMTSRQTAAFFDKYDVLLTPTLPVPPPPTGFLDLKGLLLISAKAVASLNAGFVLKKFTDLRTLYNQTFAFMPFTPIFNATGQPAMSVPLYWNDQGLPIGMQFAGRFGDEATLFRLAGQLEKALPWADRIPPV